MFGSKVCVHIRTSTFGLYQGHLVQLKLSTKGPTPVWEIPGNWSVLERVDFAEDRTLSGAQCQSVHPPVQPFSPKKLISVV